MPSQTPENSPLDEAALEELVAQFHHKLLSLEADLKDRARAGKVGAGAFIRRVRRLEKIATKLRALQKLTTPRVPGKLGEGDIGLPVLEDCTPAEHAVCGRYLEDRSQEVKSLADEAGRVFAWLASAAAGRTNPFSLTLHLSKLRNFIQRFERDADAMSRAETALTAQEARILTDARGPARRESSRSTLDGLVELFTRLDKTIARVAKLKAAVRHEESRTNDMINWLKREEQTLAALPKPTQPSPLDTARATTGTPLPRRAAKARGRHRMIEAFWTDVIEGGTRPPDEATLARASRWLSGEKP